MPRIVFVLPVAGGSGGAHSVMQEVSAMRDLGIDAEVLVNQQNHDSIMDVYSRYDWARDAVIPFSGPRALGNLAAEADVVVATTNASVVTVAEAIAETKGKFRTAYYVQDYEPLFYEANSVEHGIALTSYALLPNCTYFAKTGWLCRVVKAAHGHEVVRVVPSIDHTLYRPARRAGRARRMLCAMVRPSTPRRAPRRTLAMLERAASGAFGPVDVVAFGATPEEMQEAGLALPEGVSFAGRLRQEQVAAILREADFFADLSDYQAFGRTAAEAVACGCIAIAPRLGGAEDFIEDGVSGMLVDTGDPAAVGQAMERLFSMSEAEADSMRYAGLECVARFTPVRAAISELKALGFG